MLELFTVLILAHSVLGEDMMLKISNANKDLIFISGLVIFIILIIQKKGSRISNRIRIGSSGRRRLAFLRLFHLL